MLKSLFATDSDSDSSSQDSDHDDIGLLPALSENISINSSNSNSSSTTVVPVNDDYLFYTSSSGQISIKLRQQKQLGIAHQLWPAASFLCHYLETNLYTLYPSQSSFNILELGAGIGLAGVFVSKLPRVNQVILTDLECVQELLKTNIQLNCSRTDMNTVEVQSASVETSNSLSTCSNRVRNEVLCWGVIEDVDRALRLFSSSSSFSSTLSPSVLSQSSQLPLLVIASDCVYWEHLFQPLYETLLYLTQHNCHIIISHVRRWKRDSKFFQMCSKTMVVEKLHEELDYITEEFDGSKRRRLQRIYRIQAKSVA